MQAGITRHVALRVQIHVACRRGRRSFTEVEEDVSPIRKVRNQEPTAANITTARVYHRFGIAHGDRRIDRVTPLLQYSDTSLGGYAMCRDDHAVSSLHGGSRGVCSRKWPEQHNAKQPRAQSRLSRKLHDHDKENR